MPIVADSPPLIFGGTPTPTTTPRPTRTPRPTATPSPRPTATPVPTSTIPGDFVENHKIFIGHIDAIKACFKREDLPEFTDVEFTDHVELAKTDKYITQEKDIYCSMQGVNRLKQNLDRIVGGNE